MQKKQNGFSLFEIVIVLVIVGILVVVLAPAYQTYRVRSNRSDAIKSILAIQVAEEKWRINNTAYGSIGNVWTGTSSLSGLYTMNVPSSGASNYTITAVAGAAQTSDTGCTTLTLTYSSGTATQTPTACWQ